MHHLIQLAQTHILTHLIVQTQNVLSLCPALILSFSYFVSLPAFLPSFHFVSPSLPVCHTSTTFEAFGCTFRAQSEKPCKKRQSCRSFSPTGPLCSYRPSATFSFHSVPQNDTTQHEISGQCQHHLSSFIKINESTVSQEAFLCPHE